MKNNSACTIFKLNVLIWLGCLLCFSEQAMAAADGEFFTVNCGPYKIVFNNEVRTYGIRTLEYDGAMLMPLSGLNGSVFVPAPAKFIGSGHTEGGSEVVEKLSLEVDGKEVAITAGSTYKGETIVYRKVGRLANLRFTTEKTITADGLLDRKRIEAVDDQVVHAINLYQWCWTAKTTEWVAQLGSGEIREGIFTDDNGFKLKEDIRWTAVYEAESQNGAMMYFPDVIKGKIGQKSCYWDKAKAYHKYYLTVDTPSKLMKGTELPIYTQVVKGFSSPKNQWKQAAKELAEKLAEIYPPHRIPELDMKTKP